MNNDFCASPQAKSFPTRLDWSILDNADSEASRPNPVALFFLRTWREIDDEFDLQWASVYEDMATITIVFSAGCQRVVQYTGAFGDPLKRAAWDAEAILAQPLRLSEIVW